MTCKKCGKTKLKNLNMHKRFCPHQNPLLHQNPLTEKPIIDDNHSEKSVNLFSEKSVNLFNEQCTARLEDLAGGESVTNSIALFYAAKVLENAPTDLINLALLEMVQKDEG